MVWTWPSDRAKPANDTGEVMVIGLFQANETGMYGLSYYEPAIDCAYACRVVCGWWMRKLSDRGAKHCQQGPERLAKGHVL